MKSKGRKLHAKAAEEREKGNFSLSLDYNDKALFAYDAEDDSLGFAEGVACRSITLRVYADLHDNRRILILAKYEMMGAVAIARESGKKQALAMPLYNLAKLQEGLGELQDAVSTYEEAVKNIENNPPERHNRPSILADMNVHMATCGYRTGDKKALERAEKALNKLEEAEEPSTYNKDVWLSGGYMRIADVLRKDNPGKAKEYMQKAEQIIDVSPKLKLRKQQWQKLNSTMFISS